MKPMTKPIAKPIPKPISKPPKVFPAITPDTGTKLYYDFLEGGGSKLFDQSGQGNDGTIYGAKWTAGRFADALKFDATDDYVDCGTNIAFESNDSWSIVAWVYRDTLGDLPVVSRISVDPYGWVFGFNVWDKLRFTVISTTAPPGASILSVSVDTEVTGTGKWTFVGVTYNGNRDVSGVKLFLHGKERTDRFVSYNKLDTATIIVSDPVRVASDGSKFFGGRIDLVYVVEGVLTPKRIWEIYEETRHE